MTKIHVFLLSATCYIILSIIIFKIATWIAKKKQKELKNNQMGLLQNLGLGFVLALIFSSLAARHEGIWTSAIVFTFFFVGFGLILGLLDEFL